MNEMKSTGCGELAKYHTDLTRGSLKVKEDVK
jgi:hypothetical protein